jgi:hypothetical protein
MRTGLIKKMRARLSPGMVFNASLFRDLAEKTSIKNSIMRMRKSSEIEILKKGTYKYIKCSAVRTKKEIIWHLVRSHGSFSKAAITKLSEASHETVKTYLREWRDAGFLALNRKKNIWRLISDPGPEVPKCQNEKKSK